MVHDYQLTTIGNALKYFGYSFNSNDPKELADAEKLLIESKPHLFGINSDYQPSMRSGDAWMSVCWTGDAVQLHRDMPEMRLCARQGRRRDLERLLRRSPRARPTSRPPMRSSTHLLTPEINAIEVQAHGYPATDARTNKLVPKEMLENPILYPAAEALAPLEFGAAATLTNPLRAEIMARFKSA